ncbi:hypothetical protein [Halorussus lipolyticus]|uniref:hypothetical protein n=1 Tax=Halorussus lipolyticus TaxID=3034024 RepID=UPI0023E8E2F8|nr:hypothetical protein [Halorussus sp. DT80]
MSLTAVVSSTANGVTGVASRLVSVGFGVGGIFVAVALSTVLVYANLLDGAEVDDADLRWLVRATLLPLLVTFFVVVLYKSVTVLSG